MPCPPLSERAWHDLFASMASGAATYRVENSRRDFILVDLNPAGEAIVGIPRSEFMGRNVTEAFPGIGQMGLLDVFRKVARTGRPERTEAAFYRDVRFAVWVENRVFRLPSGEIVCIFDDVTRRRLLESRQQGSNRLLAAMNQRAGANMLREVAQVLRTEARCDVAGIRCLWSDSIDSSVTSGRPPERAETTGSACIWLPSHGQVPGTAPAPTPGCICDCVRNGTTDALQPWFTQSGAFFANNMTAVAPRLGPELGGCLARGTCRCLGLESVMVIPLKSEARTVGLLQIGDKRPNRLSADLVGHLESLSGSVGVCLGRMQAQQAADALVTALRNGICLAKDAPGAKDSKRESDRDPAHEEEDSSGYRLTPEAFRELTGQVLGHKAAVGAQVQTNVDRLLLPLLARLKKSRSVPDRNSIALLEQGLREIAGTFGARMAQPSLRLTQREVELANLVRRGLSSKEIADLLHLSVRSVDGHRNSIRRKLGLHGKGVNLVSYLRSIGQKGVDE